MKCKKSTSTFFHVNTVKKSCIKMKQFHIIRNRNRQITYLPLQGKCAQPSIDYVNRTCVGLSYSRVQIAEKFVSIFVRSSSNAKYRNSTISESDSTAGNVSNGRNEIEIRNRVSDSPTVIGKLYFSVSHLASLPCFFFFIVNTLQFVGSKVIWILQQRYSCA